MTRRWRRDTARASSSLALVLPMLVVLALGVCEASYALLDQHIVTKLSREGSNLISRDVTMDAAAETMQSMATPPGRLRHQLENDFHRAQEGRDHRVHQLRQGDRLPALTRSARWPPTASWRWPARRHSARAPNYQAPNSDSNANLRITNVPADLVLVRGGLMYVTEIYTTHNLITPLDGFGITMPETLYSIAYF